MEELEVLWAWEAGRGDETQRWWNREVAMEDCVHGK
jgi:hypothetical protein